MKTLKMGIVMVAYASYESVKKSVEENLKLIDGKYPLFIVDNCSPDIKTISYLVDLEMMNKNVVVLSPGKNLGCHNGFNYGFYHIITNYKGVEVLVKCDDDTMLYNCIDFDEILSLFKKTGIAFLGTNFFGDNRLQEELIVREMHGENAKYMTDVVYWNPKIANIPLGFIDANFFKNIGGFKVAYRNARNEIIKSQDHLYGGEEAYISQKANELGLQYAYLYMHGARTVGNDEIDPDYMLWKYVYGFLGTYKKDFASFLKDEKAKEEGYAYWLSYSDNGMHQLWAKNYYEKRNNDKSN
ncbi:MAG TPA: glycosyltransferase [Candidatus Cloacimonas sp.]|nr:glycosyltransferase [Candidatus Cloacimonas sp.]HPS60782.1 glycosyltransferase [Candidatus Cloacimonas sp.]